MSTTATELDESARETNKKTPKVVVSNRRDIPTACFDFTGGAYSKSRRARLVSFVLLCVAVLALAFTVYLAVSKFAKSSSNNSRSEQLKNTSETMIAEYATFSSEGTNAMDLVNKYNSATSSLSAVAYKQTDIHKFLVDTLAFSGPELKVTSLEYNPLKPYTGDKVEEKPSVEVKITVTATSIGAILEFMTRISSLGTLTNITSTRSGLTSIVSGELLMNNPPASLVDKLSDMGIRYDKSAQAQSPIVIDDPDSEGTAP